MNLKLLAVLIVLCLPACGMRTVKDDSPASDLDVLVANVKADGKPILLPNGKDYCAELAATEKQQDACMGDLEDALFNANQRGARQVRTVENFAERERLRRNPCGFFARMFSARCRPKNSTTP